MRVFYQIALLILFISASEPSIYKNVAGSLSDYLKSSLNNFKAAFQGEKTPGGRFKIQHNDKSNSLNHQPDTGYHYPQRITLDRDQSIRTDFQQNSPKAIIRIFKTGGDFQGMDKRYSRTDEHLRNAKVSRGSVSSKMGPRPKEQHRLGSALNSIPGSQNIARRAADSSSTSDTESSSLEMRQWKNEFKELWIKKKIEALNATAMQGDVVNMVAARPWGVPCGDPNQHDMPWGTCMLALECEPEYRIYRGDFQCGRTKYVCCALQLTNYDMYQGFDVSFEDSGLTSDSEEVRNRNKNSAERRRKRKERDRKRRRKARFKRKRKIKKNIRKIIRQIRKILNKQYRNGTTQKKRKTKQLKKFIKKLKKQYKNDRKSVKNVHEIELVKIDSKLLLKLKEIKSLNHNFVTNSTFRDIILNGTINKQGARMLVEAYPELIPYFTDKTRRSGAAGDDQQEPKDYDVEYGMLYY